MLIHEYYYPTTREIPRPPVKPERDTFADGLELNWHDIECMDEDVATYAKRLSKEATQVVVDNVVYLEDYRGTSPDTPRAA